MCVLECATWAHRYISKRGIGKDRNAIGCKCQGEHQGRSILDLPVTLCSPFREKQQEHLRTEISAGNGMQCMLGRQKLSWGSLKAQCTQVSKITQNNCELTITDYSFASILSSLHVLCLRKHMDHSLLHREKLRPQRFSNWLPGVLHYSPPRNSRQVS